MASTTAAAARTAAANASNSSSSSGLMKWAVGGWLFFIAENAALSENRAHLIEHAFAGSEEAYHAAYGACSTAALASILWGYRKLRAAAAAASSSAPVPLPLSPLRLGLAAGTLSLGLVLASQAAPQLQVPVELAAPGSSSSSSSSDPSNATAPGNADSETEGSTKQQAAAAAAPGSWNLKVRCPFDFTDSKHHRSSDTSAGEEEVRGLDRVSRHPGLWAFGLAAAGNAALQPTVYLRAWMLGPLAVAALGGAHADSRHRRGLGGGGAPYDPRYAAQTSHVPFAAALGGRQGPGALQKWIKEEIKPLNAAVAVAVAGAWVAAAASRGRGGAASKRAIARSTAAAVQ